MSNEINTQDEYLQCPECEGTGSYDVGPECSYPASLCCGGCYKTVLCEDCEGTGEIENENFEA